ncbi:hypothetical protein [Culturomica massiliensis]|uniref:hypothetical protein n=1 Tax=Culturomica massiliensis TaxID=1841857 RepID=UPI0008396522|nr:hypothetical protein [Culturomica massiliensis]
MNNQTSILINISNLHFTFLLNSKIKHNLISPFFLSFFKEKYPPTEEGYQANQMAVEKIIRESGEAFPIFPENLKHYFFKDVYKKAGCKVVKCSNNKLRKCKSVIFNFEYNGRAYSELFYIDQSLYSCSSILRSRFLKKHKWIIDFNKLEISTKNKK